ncbi:Transforming growth factor-beta-induced protein ig-h3 [Echinococcus granulosus]|uniref:Gynecophoral canal protein n=1 Tax=Echinococcus granulosus TaxID=6210 RepID=U6IVN7_ECHGR|nr:Transforming growth factor-beta-induced protein ig-h3 [Echinococcus granulosus]EUB63684.1 Transforming growth factor-beta-induced protein ig-h3 [Echinococcus granulosus]KAH9286321.1 Transforming growth factor-beta-induced protein ig-h3 [Echinococcus granulosus]CDS15836.1 gynecophoral canal protein [Echinococcus granulosus]
MLMTTSTTVRRVALCSMTARLLLLTPLLLLRANPMRGQALAPELPEEYQRKKYGPLFQGVNLCAYKEVPQPSGENLMAWICGPVDGKNAIIKYDCCPGYKRTPIVNNECVEKNPTYMPIIPTLAEMNKVETADILHKVESALDKDGRDFTVFVPEQDSSLQTVLERDISNLIIDGRHYSGEFTNGANIVTESGYPLKVSTYRNGLVFVECQLLTKPDYETSNGLIHVTGGPIDASNRYSSVIQRLEADPDLSAFTADIPTDLRSQLGAANSMERYTVFAPTNSAWQVAKRGVNGPQGVANLVKQHMHDGLVCGQSLDDQLRLLGPSKSNTFVRGMQQPDGSRVLKDSCGAKTTFQKMDMMAGNGVVHKIDNALRSPASMDFRSALDCLASGLDPELSQGAREMAACAIDVQPSDDVVVLLPTPEALRSTGGLDKCSLYQNHVLTSQDCKMKNGHGIGTPQECLYTTKYTTSDGRHPTVANQYIRTRDGSRLHFGKAETTGLKPIPFRGGVIYPVSSVNPPPIKTMMEIIRDDRELSDTYEKMQRADFGSILNRNSPNVVFFAPQNHGWKTRDKENAYRPGQLRKLFEMHTLPHQLITGKDGNVESETIQNVKSLSGTDIKIKRNLDGNTFIGYDGLDPSHWALAIGDPILASDGVISVVDWPLVCNNC